MSDSSVPRLAVRLACKTTAHTPLCALAAVCPPWPHLQTALTALALGKHVTTFSASADGAYAATPVGHDVVVNATICSVEFVHREAVRRKAEALLISHEDGTVSLVDTNTAVRNTMDANLETHASLAKRNGMRATPLARSGVAVVAVNMVPKASLWVALTELRGGGSSSQQQQEEVQLDEDEPPAAAAAAAKRRKPGSAKGRLPGDARDAPVAAHASHPTHPWCFLALGNGKLVGLAATGATPNTTIAKTPVAMLYTLSCPPRAPPGQSTGGPLPPSPPKSPPPPPVMEMFVLAETWPGAPPGTLAIVHGGGARSVDGSHSADIHSYDLSTCTKPADPKHGSPPRATGWQRLRLQARCGDMDATGVQDAASTRFGGGKLRACTLYGDGTSCSPLVYFVRERANTFATGDAVIAWAFGHDATAAPALMRRMSHRDVPAETLRGGVATISRPLLAFAPYAPDRALVVALEGDACVEVLDVRIMHMHHFRLESSRDVKCLAAPCPPTHGFARLDASFGVSGAPCSRPYTPMPPASPLAFMRGLDIYTTPWKSGGGLPTAFTSVANDLKKGGEEAHVLRVSVSYTAGMVLLTLLADLNQSKDLSETPVVWESRAFCYHGPGANQWPCARFPLAADLCFCAIDDALVCTATCQGEVIVLRRYRTDVLRTTNAESGMHKEVDSASVPIPPNITPRMAFTPRTFASSNTDAVIVTTQAQNGGSRTALRMLNFADSHASSSPEFVLRSNEMPLDVRWMALMHAAKKSTHAALLTNMRTLILDSNLKPVKVFKAMPVISALWIGPLLTCIDPRSQGVSCLLWDGHVLPLASSTRSTASADGFVGSKPVSLLFGDGEAVAVGLVNRVDKCTVGFRRAPLPIPLAIAYATYASISEQPDADLNASTVQKLCASLDASRISPDALRHLALCLTTPKIKFAAPWLSDVAHAISRAGGPLVRSHGALLALSRCDVLVSVNRFGEASSTLNEMARRDVCAGVVENIAPDLQQSLATVGIATHDTHRTEDVQHVIGGRFREPILHLASRAANQERAIEACVLVNQAVHELAGDVPSPRQLHHRAHILAKTAMKIDSGAWRLDGITASLPADQSHSTNGQWDLADDCRLTYDRSCMSAFSQFAPTVGDSGSGGGGSSAFLNSTNFGDIHETSYAADQSAAEERQREAREDFTFQQASDSDDSSDDDVSSTSFGAKLRGAASGKSGGGFKARIAIRGLENSSPQDSPASEIGPIAAFIPPPQTTTAAAAAAASASSSGAEAGSFLASFDDMRTPSATSPEKNPDASSKTGGGLQPPPPQQRNSPAPPATDGQPESPGTPFSTSFADAFFASED